MMINKYYGVNRSFLLVYNQRLFQVIIRILIGKFWDCLIDRRKIFGVRF